MANDATPAPDVQPPPVKCFRCGGNRLAITEARRRLATLARFAEGGMHTLRGRTAVGEIPAAKAALLEAQRHAAEHLADVHGGAA